MRTRHNSSKAESKTAPASNPFQSRPFAPPIEAPPQQQKTPDIQEQPKPKGFDFAKVAITPNDSSNPPFLQRRLALTQPINSSEPGVAQTTELNSQPYDLRTISQHHPTSTIQRQVASPPPKPTYGTAKTTAPLAKTSESPYNQVLQTLTQEVRLFENAQVILDWAKIHGQKIDDQLKFNPSDVLNDAKITKKIKPQPKSESDLQETLTFMISYGLVIPLPMPPQVEYIVNSNTASFDASKKQITQATDKLEKKLGLKKDEKRLNLSFPLVETDELPIELAAGGMGYADKEKKQPREKQLEIDTAKNLEKIEAEIEAVKSSEEDESKKQKKLEKLAEKRQKAQEKARQAKGYRTFAKEVVDFLKALSEKNKNWTGGNYPGHSWGEFSVDIFLKAGLEEVTQAQDSKYPGKYWKKSVALQFFDDLNAVAEEKQFAWLGIYNDIRLVKEINSKYGTNRVQRVDNHGPDGHKLHIHLDLWQANFDWNSLKDYKLEGDRIKLK